VAFNYGIPWFTIGLSIFFELQVLFKNNYRKIKSDIKMLFTLRVGVSAWYTVSTIVICLRGCKRGGFFFVYLWVCTGGVFCVFVGVYTGRILCIFGGVHGAVLPVCFMGLIVLSVRVCLYTMFVCAYTLCFSVQFFFFF